MKTIKILYLTTAFAIGSLTAVVHATSLSTAVADTSITMSEEQVQKSKMIETVLVYGLSSEITGVLESVLFNAIHFKAEYPFFRSEKVEAELNTLAVEGSTHSMRYKAYLVLTYYRNGNQFGEPTDLLALIDNREQDKIFNYLNQQIQESLATNYR